MARRPGFHGRGPTPLILFPFNGNTKEAVGVVRAANSASPVWSLMGFVDDDPAKHGLEFDGFPVLGNREEFSRHPEAMVLAAPGRPENFRNRPDIITGLSLAFERFASLVHPGVTCGPQTRIGRNCLVMAGVVLTANVTIGDHVVILPNTVVAHDTRIENYCLIGSGVCLSGSVTVRRGCYLGSGCRVIQEATIGEQALVGLGAVVIADVAPRSVVAGCPAKPLTPGGI